MKVSLFYELMQFAFSKKVFGEKMKYIFLALIFYTALAKTLAASEKSSSSAASSLSGDDIYPLF